MKTIITAAIIALTSTAAMASETIICSLEDFRVAIGGEGVYGSAEEYYLKTGPMVLDMPDTAVDNRWAFVENGFHVHNYFNQDEMEHHMALVYTNKYDRFVTVNVVKSCIKLG
jgi:hypothetical protein